MSEIKNLLNKIHLSDCRDFTKKIPNDTISCIFTDVPYLVSKGGASSSSGFGSKNKYKNNKEKLELYKSGKLFSHNDIKPQEYLSEFYRVLEDTGHIYIMTNNTHLAEIQKQMEAVGFTINNILVMIKNNAVTNQHYMKNCEFTIFARKGGSKALNDCGVKSAIYAEMPNGSEKIHETQKPLAYVKKLIANSTKKGDIVADFFAGSGVVANACVDLGLDFLCCDIDKKYVELANHRIKRAIGKVGLFE